MSELKELEMQRNKLNKRINDIKDAETAKENALMVGKCYKVRNGYSVDEQWWLYTIVHRVNKDGDLDVSQFEITCEGKVEIEKKYYFLPYDGYIEITKGEFTDAWENTLKHAKSMCS